MKRERIIIQAILILIYFVMGGIFGYFYHVASMHDQGITFSTTITIPPKTPVPVTQGDNTDL